MGGFGIITHLIISSLTEGKKKIFLAAGENYWRITGKNNNIGERLNRLNIIQR